MVSSKLGSVEGEETTSPVLLRLVFVATIRDSQVHLLGNHLLVGLDDLPIF